MTATVEREALATAIAAGLTGVKVHALPPGSVAGPSIVIAPGGWKPRNYAQVEYQVELSILHNAPDTTHAIGVLEEMAAVAYLSALGAGWSVGDVSGPEPVEYAGQPFIAMTFKASHLVTLGS
jgi:hypothetical protein